MTPKELKQRREERDQERKRREQVQDAMLKKAFASDRSKLGWFSICLHLFFWSFLIAISLAAALK